MSRHAQADGSEASEQILISKDLHSQTHWSDHLR